MNAEQAAACYNASQAYFPLAGATQLGLFNFSACDLPYAIIYKNPENSYPEGAFPALYFLLYDDGSILQKYSSGNCYFSPVRQVRETELSVITWIKPVNNFSVEFRKEWSPNYLPYHQDSTVYSPGYYWNGTEWMEGNWTNNVASPVPWLQQPPSPTPIPLGAREF